MMIRAHLSLCLLYVFCWLAVPLNAQEKTAPQFPLQAKRIVFLGDSNTHAGDYVAWIETQLRMAGLARRPELINLGLPSETCSGLSEPDHPFPRPNVHERMGRVLQRARPDVLVVCYGMNDGIYYPFAPDRFRAYQQGMLQLIDQAHAAGAKVVLLTPPVFDAQPLRSTGKLRAGSAEQFAWFAPYEDYDQIMQRYANWILEQRDRVEMVIDIRRPLQQFATQRRQQDPSYAIAPDGVHFNAEAHRLVAQVILQAWGLNWTIGADTSLFRQVQQRQQLLHDAWLSHVGHERPGMQPGLPLDEAQAQADQLEAAWPSISVQP